MSNRKFLLSIAAAAVLSGLVVAVAFSFFMPRPTVTVTEGSEAQVRLANLLSDTDMAVPDGLNFVTAAELTTEAVVHIQVSSRVSGQNLQNPYGDMLEEFFGPHFRNRGQQPDRMRQGAGSGVIIDAEGYIVTNNHVVENAEDIKVVLNDNHEYEAELVGTDPTTDLAVIKIKADNLQPIAFGNSDQVRIGEWVLAVGNPFNLTSTVTAGIVSAKARNINILRDRNQMQIESFIQTDAAVNPGNSGGALVNLKGELIGVNTAIATPTGTFAGYSFAVPSSLVQKVAEDLIEYGAVQRALLGISIRDVDAELAEENGLDEVQGVYVAAVGEDSGAEEAGIEQGDVIVAIDDTPVASVAELQELVARNRPGDEVSVTYIRDGKRKTVDATLKNSMGTTKIVAANEGINVSGATFAEIGEELKAKLDLEHGVQISELQAGKWKSAGIKEGFIVTSVDKSPVRTARDLVSILNSKSGGILIEGVYPDGERAFYAIGW